MRQESADARGAIGIFGAVAGLRGGFMVELWFGGCCELLYWPIFSDVRNKVCLNFDFSTCVLQSRRGLIFSLHKVVMVLNLV